ncbi:RrF2 family transcriptional regulator [Pelagovum pacificum]|uniref:Rrf2 family transcriptional regulator n=1 Tax=Pelagovum pacificum TaxID=2588711 RepID=A0A5C5GAF9_9RHOB|nr:Rrf2 family transcriptional regulator [Pelagovum pacificum]QQA42460.1 Rrf2 family transcriptional regulator [Pelagovum pacificum]TNY31543.1 Rrf2 family transcriptional regulator [Pelagovum pacificum]
MRLTIRSNIAMRALMVCAVNTPDIVRKSDIARACNVSEAHLAIVINRLSRAGVLDTVRGRNGGVRLALPAEQISVGQVFRVLEGGSPIVECFEANNTCPLTPGCRLRGKLAEAMDVFYDHLDNTSVADLVDDNDTLESMLSIDSQSAMSGS